MRSVLLRAFLYLVLPCASSLAAPFLVEDGKARAEIVIAEAPPRTTLLAADELQAYVRKMTGAELPIRTQPSGEDLVRVYIGESDFTRELGLDTSELLYGAYRMVSGNNWLALLGQDTNFTPIEPWPRSNNALVDGSTQKAWNAITGEHWGIPVSHMRKYYTGSPGRFGTPDEQLRDAEGQVNVWAFDERGSFNAVCGYLRSLGVRWYLPGALGEVVPEMASLPLPKIDETVHPDFPVRRFNVRYGVATRDTAMWSMRLGIRDPYGLQVAHGMHSMTHSPETLKAHPDWFALYGDKRDNLPGERLNHLCYSNPELFEATVQWARDLFDHYEFDTVSVMPPDAYISICQCSLCEGKDDPDLGSRGKLSNHVWDYVNRVAKEVGKTHPDKQIVCCAYGANTQPPTRIEKLEPNVQVIIVGGRRPRSNLPEQRGPIEELREGWLEKTDRPIMIFENYPFTARGFYLPAFVGQTIGDSIQATKGSSLGEDIWLSFSRDFDTKDIGFNHFQVYFTARMYWGGKEQSVEPLLEEYCRLFYGPAAEVMQEFFAYCEANWQQMESEKPLVDAALELFAEAQNLAPRDSVYAARLALIDDFLESLRSKSAQLGRKRGPVPKLRMVWDAEDIVIDGNLDEDYWQDCPSAATAGLRELETGQKPIFGTTVMSGWKGDSLYLAIRCEENPGEPLNIGTTKPADQALWYGDAVEVLLETDSHSYYQIAVNPAGVVVDLDRGADKSAWFRWESQAEVATQVADDHWIVEMRIPVTDDENDPLNQVIGRQPSASLPWFINVCRQRIREDGRELSAFSPTGTASFHEVMKFGIFYDGKSQAFDAAEPENDYLQKRRHAEGLSREEALDAFTALSKEAGLTDFQRCDALLQAAQAARALKRYDTALELANQAPVPAVKAVLVMETLLAQREYDALLTQFGNADLSQWPFWIRGTGAALRGRAFLETGNGEAAAADLDAALLWLRDDRDRINLLRAIAKNFEVNLQNPEAALQTLEELAASTKYNGSAEYYGGILEAARLYSEEMQFQDATRILDLVNQEQLRGTWRGAMFLARADLLAAEGKAPEAQLLYEAITQDAEIPERHRELARERLDSGAL